MTEAFPRIDGVLHAEQVSLESLAARYGTPTYVYSRAGIEARWREFDAAFAGRKHRVCFAVKANSCLGILQLLAKLGAGFDVVSGGEIQRVLRAGGRTGHTVYSGVGKSVEEIRLALKAGIGCLNVESEAEFARIESVASETGTVAPIAVRVNPDLDAGTHPHIATGSVTSKFGVPWEQAKNLYSRAAGNPAFRIVGMACHIGSQIVHTAPFTAVAGYMRERTAELKDMGINLSHLNLGGGLGVRYRDETPPRPDELATAMDRELNGLEDLELLLEPGRWICAEAGVMLARVEYLKQRGDGSRVAIVDAAMNDLQRPVLYDAWHDIEPVGATRAVGTDEHWDLAGPVCESADVLARDRCLPLVPGMLLAIRTTGAYGAVMASNYNTRPRPVELLVTGNHTHVLRRRETIEELLAAESLFNTS